MKVTFILHSSFLVELEHCSLLFDYYEGELPKTDPEKPLYVFASHSHGDHFSPAVFQLAEPNRKVFFLLSNDIFEHRVPQGLRENTVFVSPHSTYRLEGLEAATLESTDMGVAFLVRCEEKLIYHAGDLNCWVWDGAPRFQNDAMQARYKNELKTLEGKKIGVAFVPLDPRQGDDFCLGMKYFFDAVGARYVFPMHMWEDYSVVPRFKAMPMHSKCSKYLMDVTTPGQVFEISV